MMKIIFTLINITKMFDLQIVALFIAVQSLGIDTENLISSKLKRKIQTNFIILLTGYILLDDKKNGLPYFFDLPNYQVIK